MKKLTTLFMLIILLYCKGLSATHDSTAIPNPAPNQPQLPTQLYAYILITTAACNTCCLTSIDMIAQKLADMKVQSIEILFDNVNKPLMNIAKKKEHISKVGDFSEKKNLLKKIVFSSTSALVLADSSDNVYFQIPELVNTPNIISLLDQTFKKSEYNITANDSIGIVNIMSPFYDQPTNSLIFVLPEHDMGVQYKLDNNSCQKILIPTQEDKFACFDSTRYEKKIWDVTYQHYKAFIHNYVIYKQSNNIKSFVSIFSGYHYDTIRNKPHVVWEIKYAILDKKDSTTHSVKVIDSPIQPYTTYNALSSRLNDTSLLMAFKPFKDTSERNPQFYIVNTINDSIQKTNLVDSIKQQLNDRLFMYATNRTNKVIIFDTLAYRLLVYEYQDNNFKLLNNQRIHFKKQDLDNLVNILAYKDILYFVFYIGNNTDQLYIQEYSLQDLAFTCGYSLVNNPKYATTVVPVEVNDNGYYQLSRNSEGEWIVEQFALSSTNTSK